MQGERRVGEFMSAGVVRIAAAFAREFKTKTSQAASKLKAQQAAKAATGGRDPYGLFKDAIAGPMEAPPSRPGSRKRRELRAAYSRGLINEV